MSRLLSGTGPRRYSPRFADRSRTELAEAALPEDAHILLTNQGLRIVGEKFNRLCAFVWLEPFFPLFTPDDFQFLGVLTRYKNEEEPNLWVSVLNAALSRQAQKSDPALIAFVDTGLLPCRSRVRRGRNDLVHFTPLRDDL